jgi:hypothetical protein
MSLPEQPDLDYRDVSPADVWQAIDELYAGLENFVLDPVSRARDRERLEAEPRAEAEFVEFFAAQNERTAREYPRAEARAIRIRRRLNALWRDWAAGIPVEDARRRLVEIDVELDAIVVWWQEVGVADMRGAIATAERGGEPHGYPVSPAGLRAMRDAEARDRRELAALRRRLFVRRALLGLVVARRRPIRARTRGRCGHARRRRSRAPPDADCDGDDPDVGRRRRGRAP